MVLIFANWPVAAPTLAIDDWGNLLPLIIVAIAVIYQIVRGLSESARQRPGQDSQGEAPDPAASGEQRLRELAERRRRQLQELAERRRKAAESAEHPTEHRAGGDAEPAMRPGESRHGGETTTGSPVTPPRAPHREREASQPWVRAENEQRRQRQAASEAEAEQRTARREAEAAENRARQAEETERERQQRLRRAAERAERKRKRDRSATPKYGSRASDDSGPRVTRPARLVSPKHEITAGEVGAGQTTQAVGKKPVGHAAWARKLRNAKPRSLQRAMVLKEVLDLPVALRDRPHLP